MRFTASVIWWGLPRPLFGEVYRVRYLVRFTACYLVRFTAFVIWWGLLPLLFGKVYCLCYLVRFTASVIWWGLRRPLFGEVYRVRYLVRLTASVIWWGLPRPLFGEVYCVCYLVRFTAFVIWWGFLRFYCLDYYLVDRVKLCSSEFDFLLVWWIGLGLILRYRGADKSLVRPEREKNYSHRRFWVSYILFIIIIGEILVLFIYITRLASNGIF